MWQKKNTQNTFADDYDADIPTTQYTAADNNGGDILDTKNIDDNEKGIKSIKSFKISTKVYNEI